MGHRASVVATTIPRAVEEAAAAGAGDAVVFGHARLSYAGLATSSKRIAGGLRSLGVAPGDHVGYLMGNDTGIVELLVAVLRIGAVAVPLNARYKGDEIAYVVSDADLGVLFVDATYTDAAADALGRLEVDADGLVADPRFPALRVVVGDGDAPGWMPVDAFAARTADPVDVDGLERRVSPDDVAVILYTSGTTARPKGAMHTQASILAAGASLAERVHAGPDDRWWSPLPLFHVAPLTVMVACFVVRCTFVHVGFFEPGVALAQLERERCTLAFPAFATIWLAVLDHRDFASADLSHLRCVMNIGVPESLRTMQARVPWAVQISGYGATESGGFLSIGVPGDTLEHRTETTGTVLDGMEVDVVDLDTGRFLGPGHVGELVYRGPSRLVGYHGVTDDDGIDADGWFRSGDVFHLDGDGRLRFVERVKDMLKVGGENVAAAEVEDHLLRHDAVRIVQVVAAPDARYGEVPCAFVETEPGVEVTDQELIDFCRGRIATFKVPRYVRFVTSWPMSGTKIQKFVLRDTIAADLAARGVVEAPRITSS